MAVSPYRENAKPPELMKRHPPRRWQCLFGFHKLDAFSFSALTGRCFFSAHKPDCIGKPDTEHP